MPYKEQVNRLRTVQLVTQPRGGPIDHAIDVACELARRGHDSHIVGPLAAHADRFAAAGVRWHEATVDSKADVRGARELGRLLRTLRPDVLHCQDRRAGLYGRLIGRGCAERVVYTVHGVPDGLSDLVAGNARAAPHSRRDDLLYVFGERWLDRLMPTRIVAPCTPVGRYLVEHVRLPAERIDVVPNGVDANRFTPDGDRAGQPPTALWLGLMAPVKRLDLLIRAVADIPRLRLLLLGDGPERAAVEALVATLDLHRRVELRGHVDDPSGAFAEADLFALPSAAEALPLALLQAMSCGLPVVATRVGGIPDVVRPGVDGELVDAADPAGFTTALRALADDAAARTRMGRSARERVLAEFSLQVCADRLLNVYVR